MYTMRYYEIKVILLKELSLKVIKTILICINHKIRRIRHKTDIIDNQNTKRTVENVYKYKVLL